MFDSFSHTDAQRRVEELLTQKPIEEDQRRATSDRKWKKILGFDDDLIVKRPVYSDLPEIVTQPALKSSRSCARLPRNSTRSIASAPTYSDLPETVTKPVLKSSRSYQQLPRDTTYSFVSSPTYSELPGSASKPVLESTPSYTQLPRHNTFSIVSSSTYSDLPEVVTKAGLFTNASSPHLPRDTTYSTANCPAYSDLPEAVSGPVLITKPSHPRLPRDITFYRKKGGDIVISPSPPTPSPNDLKPLPSPPHLFYVSVQHEQSPSQSVQQPDVVLHSGPLESSPILSYAKFQPASLNADITICSSGSSTHHSSSFPGSPPTWPESPFSNDSQARTETLSPTRGMFTAERFSFSHTLPNSWIRERFEWRYSSGPFVRTSSGTKESAGMKLVRISTGRTVALYAGLGSRKHSPKTKVLGMLSFWNGAGSVDLGEDFEFFAVMSLLTVVEKSRRSQVGQKA